MKNKQKREGTHQVDLSLETAILVYNDFIT